MVEEEVDPEVEEIKAMIDDFQHDFLPRKTRMKVVPSGDLTLVRIEMVLEKPVPDQGALQDRILKLEKAFRQKLEEKAIDEALREKPDIIDEHLAWVDKERIRMRNRKIAWAGAGVSLGLASFTTFLILAAYRGFYLGYDFFHPLWALWPTSGFSQDLVKIVVIWIAAVIIAAVFLVNRKRKVEQSATEPKDTSRSQT